MNPARFLSQRKDGLKWFASEIGYEYRIGTRRPFLDPIRIQTNLDICKRANRVNRLKMRSARVSDHEHLQ